MQRAIATPTTASIGHPSFRPLVAAGVRAIAYNLRINLFPFSLAVTPSQHGKVAPVSRVMERATFPMSHFSREMALTPAHILSARRPSMKDALAKRIPLLRSAAQ